MTQVRNNRIKLLFRYSWYFFSKKLTWLPLAAIAVGVLWQEKYLKIVLESQQYDCDGIEFIEINEDVALRSILTKLKLRERMAHSWVSIRI